MAAATAVDGGDAAIGGRGEGNARGIGRGIQHAQRVYRDVRESVGDDAEGVFSARFESRRKTTLKKASFEAQDKRVGRQ
jgi:hypothetical protein